MKYNYTLAILATIVLTPLFGLEKFQKLIEQARKTGDLPVFDGLSALNPDERAKLTDMLTELMRDSEYCAKRGSTVFFDDQLKAFTPDALERIREVLIEHRHYTPAKANLHVEYLATSKLHAEKDKAFDSVLAYGLIPNDALVRTEPYSQEELAALQTQWDAKGAGELNKQHALIGLEAYRLHNRLKKLNDELRSIRAQRHS